MCIYTCIYIYVYIYKYVYIYMYIYMCVCVCTCIHMYTNLVYKYMNTYVCVCTCLRRTNRTFQTTFAFAPLSYLLCCSVLQCVAVCCVCCSVLQHVAVWCSVVQCGAVCCKKNLNYILPQSCLLHASRRFISHSCHIRRWVMSHVWMIHVTLVKES